MSVVIYSEVVTKLGKTTSITASQEGLLNFIMPMVEKSVSLLFGVDTFEQETITEFYPRTTYRGGGGSEINYDVVGQRAVPVSVARGRRADLVLQPPLRSITSLFEDLSARFDQQAGDFAAGTELVEGTDFEFPILKSGICNSGRVTRLGRGWPSKQGTIKVTYIHGYTDAEMNNGGIGAHVKNGMLHMVANEYYETLRQAQSGGVDIESERLGDYSVKYASSGSSLSVPPDVRRIMGFATNYSRFI